jgi:hypothetical protein
MPLKQVYDLHRENRDLLGETVGRVRFRKSVDHLISQVTIKEVSADLSESPEEVSPESE